jgi:hypothetical protein
MLFYLPSTNESTFNSQLNSMARIMGTRPDEKWGVHRGQQNTNSLNIHISPFTPRKLLNYRMHQVIDIECINLLKIEQKNGVIEIKTKIKRSPDEKRIGNYTKLQNLIFPWRETAKTGILSPTFSRFSTQKGKSFH